MKSQPIQASFFQLYGFKILLHVKIQPMVEVKKFGGCIVQPTFVSLHFLYFLSLVPAVGASRKYEKMGRFRLFLSLQLLYQNLI